jgi:hypothetical protein
MLWQQFEVGRVYFDFLNDSRVAVLMGKRPVHRAEVILLELIPLNLSRVLTKSRPLIFTAEPIPLWSANVEEVRLIEQADTTERIRLNVVPDPIQTFPFYDQRICINIENVIETSLNHELPQLDARVRCYMGRYRHEGIASIDFVNAALDAPGNGTIFVPRPILDVILGPNLILSVGTFQDQLTSKDSLSEFSMQRSKETLAKLE